MFIKVEYLTKKLQRRIAVTAKKNVAWKASFTTDLHFMQSC